VVIWTTWPPPRDVEEAGEVDADDGGEVGLGVAGEGPGDEESGIVDERVDAPEPRHAFGDRAFRRLPVRDVAGHRQNIVIVRRLDRPRGRDHPVVALAIRVDQGLADALRCTGDDGNFPFGIHGTFLSCFRGVGRTRAVREDQDEDEVVDREVVEELD
jgi:hypothetical protein